jgi:hypothetical protein
MRINVLSDIRELQDSVDDKVHVKTLHNYLKLLDGKIVTLEKMGSKPMDIESVHALFQETAHEVFKTEMRVDTSTEKATERQMSAALQAMNRAIQQHINGLCAQRGSQVGRASRAPDALA